MTFGLLHAGYSFPEWQAVKLTFFAPCCNTEFSSLSSDYFVRLHEGPSIFNFALIFFKSGTHEFFFARCVPGLTIIILFVTKSLHVSNYSKCKHNAVSVPCFYRWVRGEDITSPPFWVLSFYSFENFPNVFLFPNPGACKSRRCFPTIIQVSVKNVCIQQ